MNLIKNVTGDWEASKQKLRSDLDEIQRNINNLTALVTAVTPPVPIPPAVISSANTVTTFTGDFLRTVATVPLGGLTGNGTITNPLGFGGLSLVVSSGLVGKGTSASPLGVNVDGSTITINGSNQLVASVASGSLLTTTVTISRTQMETLSSSPFVLVGGVGGKTIIPIGVITFTTQQRQFGANVNASLHYGALTQAIGGPITVVQGALTPGVVVNFYGVAGLAPASSFASTLVIQGQSLVLTGSVDTGDGGPAGGPDVNQIVVQTIYTQI